MFSLQQYQRTRGQDRFCPEVGCGGRWPKQYTHMSKYKNDKIRNMF
jgi:hypothetical protein